MKNSAIAAAISAQFPSVQLNDITVTFLAVTAAANPATGSTKLQEEFAVSIVDPVSEELRNFIFTCSLEEE